MTELDFDIDERGGIVHGRSVRRLPFEPKGRMLAYRQALRSALKRLDPQPGCGLVATYQSPDSAFVDVENAALYNVGSGAYGHLTTQGLVCKRETSPDELHHLIYRIGPLDDPDPSMGRVLATADATTFGTLTAGTAWRCLRPTVSAPQPLAVHQGAFAVDLTVRGNWSGPGVAALVKPVLDGLISALHHHDGSHREAMLERLHVLGEPHETWALLVDPAVAVLGPRALVHPHGATGMAWNPADDLCTAFRVRCQPAANASFGALVTGRPS